MPNSYTYLPPLIKPFQQSIPFCRCCAGTDQNIPDPAVRRVLDPGESGGTVRLGQFDVICLSRAFSEEGSVIFRDTRTSRQLSYITAWGEFPAEAML